MFVEDVLDDILAHHGVKGQKWGVRRNRERSSEVTVVHKPGSKKLKVDGGHDHAPHEDAVKAAVAKQVAKTSGTHALSNKELQDAVNRMNLEQQFTRLTGGQSGRGKKFVDKQLDQFGNDPVGKLNQAKKFGKTIKALKTTGKVAVVAAGL